MITKIEPFTVYHIYGSMEAGACVPLLYLGYSSVDVPPNLKRGWQFITLRPYINSINGRLIEVGTPLCHPLRSGKHIMLKYLNKAEECSYEHPEETT